MFIIVCGILNKKLNKITPNINQAKHNNYKAILSANKIIQMYVWSADKSHCLYHLYLHNRFFFIVRENRRQDFLL